jgi:hypothetical protein
MFYIFEPFYKAKSNNILGNALHAFLRSQIAGNVTVCTIKLLYLSRPSLTKVFMMFLLNETLFYTSSAYVGSSADNVTVGDGCPARTLYTLFRVCDRPAAAQLCDGQQRQRGQQGRCCCSHK